MQEVPKVTAPGPDRLSSVQAFHGKVAAYYATIAASSTRHPNMWRSEDIPYAIPLQYPALFPPGGILAHPTMPSDTWSLKVAPTDGEKDGCMHNGNSSGSSSLIAGSAMKISYSRTNFSESRRSCSSGTSYSRNIIEVEDGPVDTISATGSNPSDSVSPGVVAVEVIPDQRVRDKFELRREKRKQTNRESARRSRLRKQYEYEELQHRVHALNNENHFLRKELQKVSEECNKVTSENDSIKLGNDYKNKIVIETGRVVENLRAEELSWLELAPQELGGKRGLKWIDRGVCEAWRKIVWCFRQFHLW
ncbi:hypothetical protein ACET3Z_018030 [Daucus carota]